jgi:hypothetical protein
MVDLAQILASGGAGRIALLNYCVFSVTMEPLFVFLTGEYRDRPSHQAALALYDVFCAQQAPARLAAYELLPPRELNVPATIARLREQWKQMQSPQLPEGEEAVALTAPSRNLFDAIARGVRAEPDGRWTQVSATFDPLLTPHENLPGGAMTAGQRQFVDNVWQPMVRPRLVQAGFWQLRTLG